MALGLLLTAHGATTKVTVNLWSGEVVMGNWSGYVVLSAEQVSSLEPGCRVVVSVKDVDSSAGTPQVYLQKSNWTDFSPAVKSIVKNAGIESFDITDELFAEINGKGLVVKGCHATLTKIAVQKEVELGEGGDFDSAVTCVWEGDTFISWEEPDKGWGVINSDCFKDVKSGNVLRFGMTDVRPWAQASIVDASWRSFADAPIKTVGLPFYEYTVTTAMLESIRKTGLIVSGNGYRLTSIDVVDPAKMPAFTAQLAEGTSKLWAKGSEASVTLEIQNLGAEKLIVPVKAILSRDNGEAYAEIDQTAIAEPGATSEATLELGKLEAGMYKLAIIAGGGLVESFNIACNPEGIAAAKDAQPDFDSFWNDALQQLAGIDPSFKITELPEKSGSKRRLYLVEMQSIPDGLTGEPVTIRAYYAEPVGDGKYPVVITYQGYDSAAYGPDGKPVDPYCPSGDQGEWAELILSTRGQSINNREPYTNTYGDWFAFNFGDKESYYYRGAYMDCIRAIDFVSSRDKVDSSAIFAQGQSQGGAFTIAAAALDPQKRLKAIAPAVPFMGDFPTYFTVAAWPRSVAVAQAAQKGMSEADMYRFLSYFDTKNLAGAIECPVIQAIGLQDPICPVPTNMAPFNNLKVPNRKLIVNENEAHSVPSGWYGQYMDWFKQAIEGMPDYMELTSNIFRGEFPVQWSALTLDASKFKYVKAGDVMKISISSIAEDRTSWPQLKVTDSSGNDIWTPTALYDSEKGLPTPYSAEFEIDADKAKLLQASGCKINGCAFTLASVDLTGTAEISTVLKNPAKAISTAWEGSERISWASDDTKNSVLIDKSAFTGMKEGTIVRVSMSEVANNAQLRLQANYTQFDPVSNTQLKGATSADITFDEAMIALVKEKGLRLTGCYYTLDKVEFIDASQMLRTQNMIATSCIKTWEEGEKAIGVVDIQSLEAHDYNVTITATVYSDLDKTSPAATISKEITLPARSLVTAEVELGDFNPGFYTLSMDVNGSAAGIYNIGFNPTQIEISYDGQPDFDEFWSTALNELKNVASQFNIVSEVTEKSTSTRKVWYVEMQSIADEPDGTPVIISGYYAEPVAEGTYPCLIHFQGTDGGTSTPWCMDGDSNPEWCEFVLSVRGQMLNNRDPHKDRNIYTLNGMSYYTYGLADDDYKHKHYYYGAYLDCVRAIDFVESRTKVDTNNIFCEGGSQGGAFTYVAAALANDRIRAVAPGITGHADFPVDFKVAAWPANQILPLAEANGISETDMLARLSYFDVKNFAHMVKCPVTTNLSLQDTTDPARVGFAPFNLLDVETKEYLVNPLLGHATAHDWSKRYMEFFERHKYDISTSISRPESTPFLNVEGRMIKSCDEAHINVYNIAGCLIADGYGTVLIPSPGAYIVKAGNRTEKIICR